MSQLVKCTIVTELMIDRDAQLFGCCALRKNWLGLEYPFVSEKCSLLESVVCLLSTYLRDYILGHIQIICHSKTFVVMLFPINNFNHELIILFFNKTRAPNSNTNRPSRLLLASRIIL